MAKTTTVITTKSNNDKCSFEVGGRAAIVTCFVMAHVSAAWGVRAAWHHEAAAAETEAELLAPREAGQCQ